MGYRVLLVDDDDVHLLAAGAILSADGHEVLTHRGAFGATGRIMKESPDLVLVDVNMPALSGEGLVKLVRERPECRACAIVLHSSNDAASLREAAGRLGLEGWVCKGDPAALRAAVREHGRRSVERRGAAPAAPAR